MNNTTFIAIVEIQEFYNKTYAEFNKISLQIIKININDLIINLPANLKTPAKLKFLKTFGKEITQEQFVQLLMYQTTGADFMNIVYIAKYYKLDYDTNKMLLWTEACPYVSLKQEAINNWHIWHTLSTHAMFSKYMTLCEFKLQNRLEYSIFPTRENFRDDLHFVNLALINSTNEKQHHLKSQQILDAEKIALNKMNGNSVISFYTNSMVDIVQIKQTVYKELYTDHDGILDTILQQIYAECNVMDAHVQTLIKHYTLSVIRVYFKKTSTIAQKKNIIVLTAMSNAAVYITSITHIVNNYLQIVNRTIHIAIRNNNYVKCYMSTLLDTLLSACLNNFEFRQDYIQTIVMENLLESMNSDLDYLYYLQSLQIVNKKNMYDQKEVAFNNLQSTAQLYIDKPQDFIRLFALKVKSLQNTNNTKVITFTDICNLYELNNTEEIHELRDFLNIACCIKVCITDLDIRISWKQLQVILFTYNNKISLQRVLSLYYTEIDTIYEVIISRLQADAKRLICTPDNFTNYSGRMYKKFSTVINKYKISLQTMTTHNTGLNLIISKFSGTTLQDTHTMPKHDIVVPPATVLESIIGFTYIDLPDAKQIANADTAIRMSEINNRYNLLQPTSVVTVTDIVDPDELE